MLDHLIPLTVAAAVEINLVLGQGGAQIGTEFAGFSLMTPQGQPVSIIRTTLN